MRQAEQKIEPTKARYKGTTTGPDPVKPELKDQ